MPITTLLGLSFGVVPCLLFGFIMLLSLLICEYIEEYVAKHLCAWKNRRRRGLRSFYRDFRDSRNAHNSNSDCAQQWSSRNKLIPTTTNPDGGLLPVHRPIHSHENPALPSAPPNSDRTLLVYGAQISTVHSNQQVLPLEDSPPSYEECILPRIRLQARNTTSETDNDLTTNTTTLPPRTAKSKKSKTSRSDKDKL